METTLRGGQRHVYGTGERFDGPDQQGRGSCGQVAEHFTRQGPWSYLPVPMFLTDGGFGWFRDAEKTSALPLERRFILSLPQGKRSPTICCWERPPNSFGPI